MQVVASWAYEVDVPRMDFLKDAAFKLMSIVGLFLSKLGVFKISINLMLSSESTPPVSRSFDVQFNLGEVELTFG